MASISCFSPFCPLNVTSYTSGHPGLMRQVHGQITVVGYQQQSGGACLTGQLDTPFPGSFGHQVHDGSAVTIIGYMWSGNLWVVEQKIDEGWSLILFTFIGDLIIRVQFIPISITTSPFTLINPALMSSSVSTPGGHTCICVRNLFSLMPLIRPFLGF